MAVQSRIKKKTTQPQRRWRKRLLLVMVCLFLVLIGVSFVSVVQAYHTLEQYVPGTDKITTYEPQQITSIYGADHQLIGEFYTERRIPVTLETVPKKLILAFLASEDKLFFEHQGIDYVGLVRSAVRTLLLHSGKQGASTISMQVAKSFLDSETRQARRGSLMQKIRYKLSQIVLAQRLEAKLSKQDILTLYLNHIYLGHGAYGVQAAAENYFRKNVFELSLGEMAVIAGLPQSPSRYDPYLYQEKAVARRRYVLRRMQEEGFINQQEHDAADKEPLVTHPVADPFRDIAPYFVETVRRHLIERYGEKALYEEGLVVDTTLEIAKQAAAEKALMDGLLALDKRQGFRGPLIHLAKNQYQDFLQRYQTVLQHQHLEALAKNQFYVGLVVSVDKEEATVRVGTHIKAKLPLFTMRYARKPNPNVYYEYNLVSRVDQVLSKGDVVFVRKSTREEWMNVGFAQAMAKKMSPQVPFLALEQMPAAEGALLSAQPHTGEVLAMVGGFDFDRSELNRTMQACRQPGSAFKPIVYATAFDHGVVTPATLIPDTPIVMGDLGQHNRWKPENSHAEFKGDVTVRSAIQLSLNIPAIKTLEKTGVQAVVDNAKQFGIRSPLYADLSLALGASCVTLFDLTTVYGMFANLGVRPAFHLINRVETHTQQRLEDDADFTEPAISLASRLARLHAQVFSPPARVLKASTAYVTLRQLMNVVQGGTGSYAARVGDFVAGKTGTTNDQFDAWFMGFSPDIVTGVWVGHDKNERPLGALEFGGRAALPIWTHYMQEALRHLPQEVVAPPPGVVAHTIDLKTGTLASQHSRKTAVEYFIKGYEPSVNSTHDDASFYGQDADRPF